MNKILGYAAVFGVGLAVVAVVSPFSGVPADQLLMYTANAALLGVMSGALLGWVIAERGTLLQLLGGGWVFLALAYGVGQGGLAVAAANGFCWGLALLLLVAVSGGVGRRARE